MKLLFWYLILTISCAFALETFICKGRGESYECSLISDDEESKPVAGDEFILEPPIFIDPVDW